MSHQLQIQESDDQDTSQGKKENRGVKLSLSSFYTAYATSFTAFKGMKGFGLVLSDSDGASS